jgi:2-polyprenyl-3-methyl-5-hydroxy-6-metoxy-1,4-benzoquinol methylase
MSNYSKNFYDSVSNRAVVSARITAEVLSGSLSPKSVVDIGSGQGVWLHSICEEFSTVERAVALDLQPHESIFFEELKHSINDFEFVQVNFEESSKIPNQNFDLAICLEVLEHLSPKTAVRVAQEMGTKCSFVIFSAAISGQGGTGHINERKFSYWMNLMAEQGFIALDVFRPALSKSKEVPGYYKQNMMLFWHPENSQKSGLRIDLEKLLSKNRIRVADTRSVATRIRYGVISLIPSVVVTALVKVLDKTIRKITQQN